ncbi:MAG: L-seryl-tRNA(Sec) selenium transferase [Thermoleophilaceae bacterium]
MAASGGSAARVPPDRARLRELPAVGELAERLAGVPPAAAVRAAREVISEARERVLSGGEPGDLERAAAARLSILLAGTLRPVVNATGVIVHTNLGRAPLADAAREAAARSAAGYANLEYDVELGERGSRQTHVEPLLTRLTGAEAAIAVNNCAGAVLLACAALASGREIVVSRGHLVEIGGSFRIPEVAEQSGARLVEVGTTNRTRPSDYERALGPQTGAVLRAHPSNFRTLGFVEEVAIEQLCTLAHEEGVPVIDDAGSGVLADAVPELADEPAVRRSVTAGAALVCFSGDKLLGGPQAGLLVGSAEAVSACRAHPLARALRIDKLSLAALAATLRLYLDPEQALLEILVLRMLRACEPELRARAERMRDLLAAGGVAAEVVEAAARVGGGALPLLELEGPVCAIGAGPLAPDELARRLRAHEPPVIGRVREDRLLLDPRTLDDAEAELAAAAAVRALER